MRGDRRGVVRLQLRGSWGGPSAQSCRARAGGLLALDGVGGQWQDLQWERQPGLRAH